MRKIILFLIKIYQKTFSFDHSFWAKKVFPFGFCKYQPTCSEYMYLAIEKKGLFKGILLGIWRILRCNPFSKGGYDPLP